MGCDIHGWVEVKHGDKYIAIKEMKNRDRNYARFAALAGVRDYEGNSTAKPKGIPEDVSDTAKYDIEQWGSDGHSHSYIPLSEAAKIFLNTEHKLRSFAIEYPESEFFDIDLEDSSNARLVFWFDN